MIGQLMVIVVSAGCAHSLHVLGGADVDDPDHGYLGYASEMSRMVHVASSYAEDLTHQKRSSDLLLKRTRGAENVSQDVVMLDRLESCVQATHAFTDADEIASIAGHLLERKRVPTNSVLAYVHIPKNGGTTMTQALQNAWAKQGCGLIDFRSSGIDVTEAPAHRQEESTNRTHPRYGIHVGSNSEYFPDHWLIEDYVGKDIYQQVTQNACGVIGHLAFGYCDRLKSNCTYATLLREPIERYISHVSMECRIFPSKYGSSCASISAFTRNLLSNNISFYGVDNHQTRMLIGDCFHSPFTKSSSCLPTFHVGKAHLRQAVIHLALYFSAWGVLDDLMAFNRNVREAHGYDLPMPFEPQNVRPDMQAIDADIDASTLKDIKTILGADLGLYDFAKCVLDAEARRSSKTS